MDEIKITKPDKKQMHRNGEIDFLRFVFAIIIVLHHSRYILGDDRAVFLGGSLGVEFFFLVSGYLLMNSVQRAALKPSKRFLGSETFDFIMGKIKAFLPEWIFGWTIGFVFVLIAENIRGYEIFQKFKDLFWELSLLRSTGMYVSAINGVMWYLTAMLICMAILYPLLRRFPDMMSKVVCPLAALLILGYLFRNCGSLRDPHKWLGFTYKGNLRAMAELCLGVVMYRAAAVIRRHEYTAVCGAAFSLIRAVLYVQVIWFMYTQKPCEEDFYYLFLLFAAVMLSFSGTGSWKNIFNNSCTAFLARYSTAVFFAHIYFAQHLNSILPDAVSGRERLVIYLALSFINGFAVMGLSALYRKKRKALVRVIRHICIADKDLNSK